MVFDANHDIFVLYGGRDEPYSPVPNFRGGLNFVFGQTLPLILLY